MSGANAPRIDDLLDRITDNPEIYGGKPIIRSRRLAVERVLAQLAVRDSPEALLDGHPWLEREDILACLAYAYRAVANGRFVPVLADRPA